MLQPKCKRIIDGKTYNTETATQIAGYWDEENPPFSYGNFLFQSRFGAFFRFEESEGISPEDDYQRITPLTPDEARAWLEKFQSYDPEMIERLFGEMPEAGSGEVKFTLRMPESLRTRLAAKAEANKQSLNAWMVRCLEFCASGDDKP